MATAGSKRSRRGPAASFIIHFQARDPSDEDLSAIVEAPNAGSARRQARDRFPGQAIVSVEKGGPIHCHPGYPNARFIKGRFRSVECDDDSAPIALRK